MSFSSVFTFSPYAPPRSFSLQGACVYFVGNTQGSMAIPAWVQQTLLRDGFLRPKAELAHALASFAGNFAVFVEDRNGQVLAATDKVRSYPVFYAPLGGDLYLGTDPYQIVDEHPNVFSSKEEIEQGIPVSINRDSLDEFRLSGYVTRGETLVQGLSQLPAGAFLLGDHLGVHVQDYYHFYTKEVFDEDEDGLVERLHHATVSIFEALARRLHGRPVWIALSAGLDSRLVLCHLKRLGYDRIQTFTYGLRGNHEARWAKEIAARVGVPWRFVPYSRSRAKTFFASETFDAYSKYAHGISSVPYVADLQALSELQRAGQLPEDVVLLNGHTGDFISGGHIPAVLEKDKITDSEFLQAVIRKHYQLWTHPKMHQDRMLEMVERRIRSVLPIPLPSSMDREGAMKLIECWEWRTRQTLFVNGAMRQYDHLGLSWELPLWDDPYLHFWSRVPFQAKFRQRLYKTYLEKENLFGVFQPGAYPMYLVPAYTRHLQRSFRMFGSRQAEMAHTFLAYWQNSAFYYAMNSYRDYLRLAKYHRSPISYHAKKIMEDQYGVSFL